MKLAIGRALVELRNSRSRDVVSPGDDDRLQPTALSISPQRGWGKTGLLEK
jgi:hypothetical protein